ncbi:MAG TPA: SusC/RagA family TonB-linked outer membrane protein [Flavitalea sp.]|nr:SusC/RagA family TonB-linked outer membrane protein [Flavitalea sp.]
MIFRGDSPSFRRPMNRFLRMALALTGFILYSTIVVANPPAEKYPVISGKASIIDTLITGKIIDQNDGKPLSQVSVQNLRTRKGTSSNLLGEYSIDAETGDSISFSYTGKALLTVAYQGQGTLNVEMSEKGAMAEVIFTGYQTIDKKKFAGASVALKFDDVKMNGVPDVSRMLEGRAAGVSVQNVSGTFGTAPKIRVRGATSINGDNKPLWVVDGVVLEDIVNISNDQLSSGDPTTLLGSAVAGLNSNDIESFDILKDASATALYGARAMNGVVVITTKKGKTGKPTVSYSASFSTQLKPDYASYNIMNSVDQMSVLGELERKGALNPNILNRADNGVYGKMYELMSADANGNFPLQNTPEARKEFLSRYATANTDWFDLLFQNNLMQEHSLSIASGADKSQYYFSLSYYGDNGWTIADKVNRYTANFRNNYKFSDRLSTGFSTVVSVRNQRAPGALGRNSNPVEGTFDRDFDINPFSYALNTSRTLTAYDQNGNLEYFRRNFAPFNIINELQNNYLDLSVADMRVQGDLTYKITKDLRFEFVGALRYVESTREHQITENSNMAEAYRSAGTTVIKQNNRFLYRDPDDPNAEPIVVLPYGGFYNRAEDKLVSYDIRNSINYSKIFDKHAINLLGGMQVKSADRQAFSNTGYGYQYGTGGVPFIDYRILKQTIENNFPYYEMSKFYDRFVALYGTGNYTYDSRYNLTATVRYDGSNRLGKSRQARWLPTWSVAGSWNVDRESFMDNVNWLDYLTLRASYGLTASLGPATNSSIVLQNVISNRPYLTEKESVIQLVNLENSEITWEKLYTANVGLDAGFFNRRMNVSMDIYTRKSFDLISRIKTSGIGGELYKAANYADMDSYGAELLVGGTIVQAKDWGWRSTLTFGYNETRITDAQNEPRIFDLVAAEGGNKVGYPTSGLFSLNFQGLNQQNGVPLFINEKGDVTSDIYLQDQNTNYLVFEGPVDPIFTGGFSNTFNYKALSLNFLLTYQAGNMIRLYPAFKANYSDLDVTPKEFYDRWLIPGDKTNIPSILEAFQFAQSYGGAYPYNNYNYSTERVAKGDFIRLKTVSLTYQLPVNRIKGINSLSVTAAGTNLWLIYSDKKLKGQDPEFFNSGGVAQPIQKQVTLAFKIGI